LQYRDKIVMALIWYDANHQHSLSEELLSDIGSSALVRSFDEIDIVEILILWYVAIVVCVVVTLVTMMTDVEACVNYNNGLAYYKLTSAMAM